MPEIPEEEKPPQEEDSGIRFSIRSQEPATEILVSWRSLELDIRKLAEQHNVQGGRSTRSLIDALESKNLIPKELSAVILDLAALRNKVAHTDEEVITYDASLAFNSAVKRVRSVMADANA